MKKKLLFYLIISFLFMSAPSLVTAQNQTGAMEAAITDTKGYPLPGATVYIYSPSFLGLKIYITDDAGKVYFPFLPPGEYRITVEMPGFKTVNIENVMVNTGKTVYLEIELEATTVEEEITLTKSLPLLDKKSSKLNLIIGENILKNIPLSRDLYDVVNTAPGFISTQNPTRRTSLVHGSSVRNNTYTMEGMNITNPWKMYPFFDLNFDVIEEIEIQTASLPANVNSTGGGYINVVTNSGGDKLGGKVLLYYTGKSLSQSLWSEEETTSPQTHSIINRSLYDTSLSLGGPVLKERGCFFVNGRFISNSKTTPFSSWRDPQGNWHQEYNWYKRELLGSFKLNGRVTNNIRFSAMFNYTNEYQPIFNPLLSPKLTEQAARVLDHGKSYSGIGSVNYSLKQNLYVYARASYIENHRPLFLKEEAKQHPQYTDTYTGYTWGSGAFNQTSVQKRYHVESHLSLFEDSFIWGTHQLKAGAEYEFVRGDFSTWKRDNLINYYQNGNPYYYGMSSSPFTGNKVGLGKVGFYTTSGVQNGLKINDETKRIGIFIQDQSTFAQKITINAGARLDLSFARKLSGYKLESGNPLSLDIGENLIKPLVGKNPYAGNDIPAWNNMIFWLSFSPRLGITFDVFGNHKTIFSASFSRYSDYLSLNYGLHLSPFYPGQSHSFFWYDENSNTQADSEDNYTLYPDNYLQYKDEYSKEMLDPGIKPPYTDELRMGIKNEIFTNFCVGLSYVYKVNKNILENVLYDPESETYWYSLQQAPEGWWIPFNTIIPGIDNYPKETLTVYFPSAESPYPFYRLTNVPQLSRKYRGFEFTFKKVMSNHWQLFGSLAYSSSTGNIGLDYKESSGFSETGESPNYFVNFPQDAKLIADRPLSIKLMGTYQFPYDFYLSFYYRYLSGAPWARKVTIIPPSSWMEEKKARYFPAEVFLETPGERRKQPFNNMDIRLRKTLLLKGLGTLDVFVDIINALGNKYRYLYQNDGGFWYPQEENTTQGNRLLSADYKNVASLSGERVFKLSIAFNF